MNNKFRRNTHSDFCDCGSEDIRCPECGVWLFRGECPACFQRELIAAAPDLLYATRHVLVGLEIRGLARSPEADHLRAAIAKAEGKEL